MSDRPIYKRNGKTISQIQVQKIIRKELRLSKAKYQKLYDITRNKLRNYERTTGAKKQSVLQFLYNRANYKARARSEGTRYYKSGKAKYIESFTSKSSGVKTLTPREQQAINLKTEKFIQKNYGEFIKQNKYANMIDKQIKDPIQKLKALNDYANKRNDLKTDRKTQVKGVPFARGERGSTGHSPQNEQDDKQAYEDIISKYGGSGL